MMVARSCSLVLLFGLALSVAVSEAHAARLDPAFATALGQAYLTNPQLRTERQRLREIDEGVPRALSGWRPTVSLVGAAGVSAVFDTNDTQHQPERRVPQEAVASITQPLYTGGLVHAQVAQSEASVRAQRAALQASESSVLLMAATAYLDVARDQAIVDLNRNQDDVLRRSLTAAQQSAAAGSLTDTDVAQARARLADQRSMTARAEGELGRSAAAYEQQVGQQPDRVAMPSDTMGSPDDRNVVLMLAASSNFDVTEARTALEASRYGISIASAGLRPKLSVVLEAERLKETDVQLPHQRDHILEGLLQLSVPLYVGGAVSADTRRAKEVAARTALQLESVLRLVRQQATTALDLLASAERRVMEQRISIDANLIAERGIARQQSVGARTVLEVLNAQQELLNARVNLTIALHDRLVAALQVLAVTGRLSARSLQLQVPIYDPVAHYAATRDRWYGTTPAR